MAAALAAEKSATAKRWSAAQKRIDRVAQSLASLVHDPDGLGLKLPPRVVTELPPTPDGNASSWASA
jgi:hypothetical protein